MNLYKKTRDPGPVHRRESRVHPAGRGRSSPCGTVSCVLASSAADPAVAFMPSEPVELTAPLPLALVALPELHLRSTIRFHQLSCLSRLVIPWRSRATRGWLVVANLDRADNIPLTRRKAQQYGRMLRQSYVESSARSRSTIGTEMAQATRARPSSCA